MADSPANEVLGELADVAALTFPLACPPSVSADNVATFISSHLTAACFGEYVNAADRTVLTARSADDPRILGYAMLIHGVPDDPDVQRAVTMRPAVELSKMYVLPESHGSTVSAALMQTAVECCSELGARTVWLGVNQENQRAQRFYTKHGFSVAGTKTFTLGGHIENDYVMLRGLY
ncbi:MAG TPA: GNAT family N-acetyltransferase [Mycobacterium sp.]|nr:GNAT family N-acetyltransferase [Mycobacterium sp.]